MKENLKYEILFFDLDDTLIDNHKNIEHAFKVATKFLNKPYNKTELERWFNHEETYWKSFTKGELKIPYSTDDERYIPYVRALRFVYFYDNKISIETAHEANELFISQMKTIIYEIDGASSLLKNLSQKYKIYITTNGPSSAATHKLETINSAKYISGYFSADLTKAKVSKPNKIYYDELLNFINFHDKSKILVIGDSLYYDILGGQNSGIDTCWFNKKGNNLENGYHPKFIINSLKKLEEILL